MSVFASVEESELEKEFEKAAADPHGLDCGFESQRCQTGFANFGFSPDKAAEMREKELARIAAELESEPIDYEDEDDDDGLDFDDDWDDDIDLTLDDDDDYDRFEESVDLPDADDDDEVDDWE